MLIRSIRVIRGLFLKENLASSLLLRVSVLMIWVVVPVKNFDAAKQRLADLLSPAERCELAAVMLADVLQAVKHARGVDKTVLVTKEPRAITLAYEFGAEIISEPFNQGETEAVALATGYAVKRNASAMLVLPGDVPLVSHLDMETILHAGQSSDVVLVPSRDDHGTNGVLLRPPGVMPLRFGYDSFRFHLETAQALGLHTEVLRLRNLDLDIDTPDDLRELALRYQHAPQLATRSRTAAFLERKRLKLMAPRASS